MFQWAERLGLRSRTAKRTEEEAIPPVRLLAITTNDWFYSRLVEIAARSAWEIRRASTIDEGFELARTLSLPLVVFDWDEQGSNWRPGLDRLTAAPDHPCILLASRVVDDNLRQEVIRFRGYDVLARSADREEIAGMIEFAWFWTTRSNRFLDRARQQEALH